MRLFLACAVTALLSGYVAHAQQDIATFRAEVALVHVDAEVRGKDGRIIDGLTQGDFRVFDERQEQRLVAFAAEQQPLDVILLVDTSSSMRSKIQRLAAVAYQGMQELKPGDRVAVMTFSETTKLVSEFTADLDSVERRINGILSLRFDGLTYIRQALDDAASYFLRDAQKQRRRAILIVTDNLGIKTRKEMSVVRSLWEADAVLCGLTVRDRGYPVRRAIVAVVAPYALAKVGGIDPIAQKTGGDVVQSEDPGLRFPEMMRRIRARYSLYYPLPEAKLESVRSIRVELSPAAQGRFPDARVYARSGYILTHSQ